VAHPISSPCGTQGGDRVIDSFIDWDVKGMLDLMDEMPPELPAFGEVTQATRVAGGAHGVTWLLTTGDGSKVVAKYGEQVPAGLFLAEAEGLAAIAATGSLHTPEVRQVGPSHLVLERLLPPPVDDASFWEEAGRAVAALHVTPGPAHGWHQDNWLGLLPQHNGWLTDGHEFFIRNRILRFLSVPQSQAVLGPEGISGIERICSRFRDVIPAMPPVLCHGDLWRGNFLATHGGRPAVIDPAVAYTWAEVDISMMFCEKRPPERFFDAYHEVHPPEPGWKDRMELLHLRELLSTVAHFGDYPAICAPTVSRVHTVIATYS
jgi:fructosamine-3-kinase